MCGFCLQLQILRQLSFSKLIHYFCLWIPQTIPDSTNFALESTNFVVDSARFPAFGAILSNNNNHNNNHNNKMSLAYARGFPYSFSSVN